MFLFLREQSPAITMGFEAPTRIALEWLEARETHFFSVFFDPSEEVLKSMFKPLEGHLTGLGVEGIIFRHGLTQVGQIFALLSKMKRDATPAISSNPLFEGCVVKLLMQSTDFKHFSFLRLVGVQAISDSAILALRRNLHTDSIPLFLLKSYYN